MQEDSVHHIFAQHERKTYKVDIKENKVRIERKKHDALHVFFADDHPREQLVKILQLNSSVIDPDIVTALQEILALDEEEFYIQEIWDHKHKRKSEEKSASE
jgi:hypothetical protein